MARPERFELPTFWFVARRSIQLSYGRVKEILARSLKIRIEGVSRPSGFRRRRTLSSRANRRHRFHHAGRQPHVPPRPPHHGADSKLVISAGGPQSADVCEHPGREAGGFPDGYGAGVPPQGWASGVEVLALSRKSALALARERSPSAKEPCYSESPDVRGAIRGRMRSGRGSAWLERLVRDQEVGGSNPLAPTILFNGLSRTSGLSSTAV
jgi:hypothetical protein